MNIAVEVYHGHTLKEGMDGEAYQQTCHRMNTRAVVAMPRVVMMLMMVHFCFLLFYTARAVVVTVFCTFSKLF